MQFLQFLEMHHIINSCTNMNKIYGNKDAKSFTPWSFPSYREDEIHWELAELYFEWGYCDMTRFHKKSSLQKLTFDFVPVRS